MIPKVIHYCWFGNNKKTQEILDCIETWKKFCPEYQLIEWNESNFDVHSNKYVEQAYAAKKWAFVADYVRLYAIYNYGGIYMDTDVEVVQSLDRFLKHKGFTGFEIAEHPLTGTMGCEKGNELIKKVLNKYQNRSFVNNDGSFDLTTNIIPFKNICLGYGFEMNNEYQVKDGFVLYPNDYFCAYNFDNKTFVKTKNTYTIHHFVGSWIPKRQKIRRKIRKLLGNRISGIISSFIRRMKN